MASYSPTESRLLLHEGRRFSLLYGAALKDGSLRSLDDPVTRYLPQLRGSAYDDVKLRQLLQMSSGVAWNEDETDPNCHLAQTGRIARTGGINDLLAARA